MKTVLKPSKSTKRKWFRLFSKPTLNFKSFEESKLKTTLFQKVLKTRFRKAKVFKRFWFQNLHGFRPEFQKFLQLTLPHWSNQFSKTACFEKFWKNPECLWNDFKLCVTAASRPLFQKVCLKKFLKKLASKTSPSKNT